MSNKLKMIGLVLVVLIAILCFVFVSVNKDQREQPKVDYTIQWEYNEGEIIELSSEDKLYDKKDKLLVSDSSKDGTAYYNLKRGEYRLLTKVILNDEEMEIKIIVY